MSLLYSILEILYVVALAPLFAGVQHSLEERLESQQDPTIFQPYFDLAKLFHKESPVPEVSSPIFRPGPGAGYEPFEGKTGHARCTCTILKILMNPKLLMTSAYLIMQNPPRAFSA